ncbi:Uncharacterised protein [Serratia fonticola]|uniref:Uncharacterized protein n=1 Tax=Serratia fonticola TaxID=47917 RepID=A0A4U9US90_SERFO|nr:Uncharacterised protein [Serratia fonticola]
MVIFNSTSLIHSLSRCIIGGMTLLVTGCSSMLDDIPWIGQDEHLSQTVVMQHLQCENADSATNAKQPPPQLYQRMIQCVDEQNYRSATLLFALAGSYTWYDAARLDTTFAKTNIPSCWLTIWLN